MVSMGLMGRCCGHTALEEFSGPPRDLRCGVKEKLSRDLSISANCAAEVEAEELAVWCCAASKTGNGAASSHIAEDSGCPPPKPDRREAPTGVDINIQPTR